MRVLIIGGGGHAQVVADVVLSMQREGLNVDIIGYLDDNPSLHGKLLLGRPVLGTIGEWTEHEHEALLVGIGNNTIRRRLYEKLLRQGETFLVAQHPQSVVAAGVELGPGTIVCAGVVLNIGSRIGANVILNTSCSVDHHNQIGNHCHIAPGAHLGGEVTVGEESLIGIGSVILPQTRVGNRCIVGAGAVVHRNVSDQTTVVGVPARVQRKHQSN